MSREATLTSPLLPDARASIAAWLVSLAAHLVIAVLATLLIRGTARVLSPDESARRGEIVIVSRSGNQAEYFTEENVAERHTRPLAGSNPAPGEVPIGSAATDQPPFIAGITLPQLPGSLRPSDGKDDALPLGPARGRVRIPGTPADEAAILAEDARIPRPHVPTGPTARLSLFGSAAAEGRSFAFVIDRSASMGGEGLGAIQAAAKEMAARIDALTSEQTFQVVAYNQSPAYLTARELIPATDENKRELIRFVANLPAFGQTEHQRGLLSALRMRPEVIFLLTDGGDPVLDAGQLRLIREEAGGRTVIHCLHFGRGSTSGTNSFLVRLASENRGSYVYIDMNGR